MGNWLIQKSKELSDEVIHKFTVETITVIHSNPPDFVE